MGKESDYYVQAQRMNNYIRCTLKRTATDACTHDRNLPGRRMVPHALGYVPMTAAWVVMIVRPMQSNLFLLEP